MKYLGILKSTIDPRSFVDGYNSTLAAVIAILTVIFGEHWYLFAAFFAFNVADYASGVYKSRKLKQESSAAGLAGIVKKLWYWVLIAIAFIVSEAIGRVVGEVAGIDLSFLAAVGWFTLACLAINEVRSFCENLVEAGIHVPAVFVKGLKVADKLLEEKTGQVVPGEENDNSGA